LIVREYKVERGFLPLFLMLFYQNNVKNVLKSIKNVLFNYNDLFISLIIIVIKR